MLINLPMPKNYVFQVSIACRRCTHSRDQFPTLKAAKAAGWTKIEEFHWQTEPGANYRGLCPDPACQDHPDKH